MFGVAYLLKLEMQRKVKNEAILEGMGYECFNTIINRVVYRKAWSWLTVLFLGLRFAWVGSLFNVVCQLAVNTKYFMVLPAHHS